MEDPVFSVRPITLDLPPLVAAFGRRLHAAGVPVSPERAVRLAEALALVGAGGVVLPPSSVLDRPHGAGIRAGSGAGL